MVKSYCYNIQSEISGERLQGTVISSFLFFLCVHQQQTAFEKIGGKAEIARNEQFLLFPLCFILNQVIISPIVHIFEVISLVAAEFEEPTIGISGKGLICGRKERYFCIFLEK